MLEAGGTLDELEYESYRRVKRLAKREQRPKDSRKERISEDPTVWKGEKE
jgi:hypothetical protein